MFTVAEGTKVYCKELTVIAKGELKPIEVYHSVTKKNIYCFLSIVKGGNVQGGFLAETNNEVFIKRIEVGGRDNTACILQQVQCWMAVSIIRN